MTLTDSQPQPSTAYVPFTPFQETYEFEAEPAVLDRLAEQGPPAPVTPFVSEYAGETAQGPESAELQELLFDLYDEEFDEVLAELAHEAWEAVAHRPVAYGETGAGPSAEHFLEDWSAPVRNAAEALFEEIASKFATRDLGSLSEADVDTVFEDLERRESGLEAHFEQFLGGLVKKAKKLAKKAVGLAKKGLAAIPGLGALLAKLKALVRPLLNRVLKSALDKLPPALRPYAQQLAQRVLGGAKSELETDEEAPAAPDVGVLQQQFDLDAATLMFASDETERELLVGEAVRGEEREAAAPIAELHEARARFVDDLEAGVSPEAALERFIPAVMAVLPIARTAIRVIGRKRVVGYLSKALAALIAPYVPQTHATQLSRAIVDAGLRLLKLEAPIEREAEQPRLAWHTLAQTVEDTVRRVGAQGEVVFEEPPLLEAALTDAFHAAAAENFPPDLLLPELHEASVRATWVALPASEPRRYYKKYTQVFDAEITRQAADSIRTFGGATLAAFLRDRLGVAAPVRARVHLYQAIPGTTLMRIARFERGVPGLGTDARASAVQFHPLTTEAAAVLLRQPGLGRPGGGALGSSRRSVAVGDRFYFLEIAGARPVMAPRGAAGAAARRTSRASVTFDFHKDEYRVSLFLGESDAQALAAKVRARDLTSALVLAKRTYEPALDAALAGAGGRRVRVLATGPTRGALPGRPLGRLPDDLRRGFARRLAEWVGAGLADYLKAGGGELLSASEDPADGVTVVVRLASPPGAPLMRALLGGAAAAAGAPGDAGNAFAGRASATVVSLPGFHFA